MAAGNMDEPAPLCSFLLCSHSSSPVIAETGWSPDYLWEQKALSPSVHTWRSKCHYMVGGRRKKKTSDIEMNYTLKWTGDRKWFQVVTWPFQRWKWCRPPELPWVNLLFQSCSNHSHQRLRAAEANIFGWLIDLQCLLQWHWAGL